mgnify:CR=1 FL=1
MSSSKFKIGIIGCGGISNAHAKGWELLSDEVEVIATCDIDQGRARKMAERFGARHVFTDFNDLVKVNGLDAVDICTPNKLHTPAVLAALKQKLHVLCEKPLAVSTDEVRSMGRLADKQKRMLMTAQHMRYLPMSASIKAFMGTGAIGTPQHARVYALRRNLLPIAPGFINSELSGGGPCMDIGVHCLDACMWLMDFPKPVRVSGASRTNFAKGYDIPGAWGEWDRNLFDVEDWATGFVHFDNGATMVLEMSWLNHQQDKEMMRNTIFGSKGSMEWPTGKYSSAANGVLFDSQLHEKGGLKEAHAQEIIEFFTAIKQEKPSPVPWTETLKVIAILEAIYQSEAAKKEIAIKL